MHLLFNFVIHTTCFYFRAWKSKESIPFLPLHNYFPFPLPLLPKSNLQGTPKEKFLEIYLCLQTLQSLIENKCKTENFNFSPDKKERRAINNLPNHTFLIENREKRLYLKILKMFNSKSTKHDDHLILWK